MPPGRAVIEGAIGCAMTRAEVCMALVTVVSVKPTDRCSRVRTYLRGAAAAKIDARAELSFETLQQMEGQFRAGARKLDAERRSRGLIDESLGSMPEITPSQAFGKYQRTVKRHGKLAPLSASSVNHRLNMLRSVMVRARECGRFAFPRSIGNRCA
jgi:hypothetical protein